MMPHGCMCCLFVKCCSFNYFLSIAFWLKYPCLAVRLAKLAVDKVLTAPCSTSVLYPKSGGNLHCFTAVTPCAVLDILAPPYLEAAGRKCTYYHDYPYSTFCKFFNSDANEACIVTLLIIVLSGCIATTHRAIIILSIVGIFLQPQMEMRYRMEKKRITHGLPKLIHQMICTCAREHTLVQLFKQSSSLANIVWHCLGLNCGSRSSCC